MCSERPLEIVIESGDKGSPVAWFGIGMDPVVQASERTWAAVEKDHICFFTLEGEL